MATTENAAIQIKPPKHVQKAFRRMQKTVEASADECGTFLTLTMLSNLAGRYYACALAEGDSEAELREFMDLNFGVGQQEARELFASAGVRDQFNAQPTAAAPKTPPPPKPKR